MLSALEDVAVPMVVRKLLVISTSQALLSRKHIQDDCILSLPHGGHASNTSQANDYVPVFMQAQNIHVGTM